MGLLPGPGCSTRRAARATPPRVRKTSPDAALVVAIEDYTRNANYTYAPDVPGAQQTARSLEARGLPRRFLLDTIDAQLPEGASAVPVLDA